MITQNHDAIFCVAGGKWGLADARNGLYCAGRLDGWIVELSVNKNKGASEGLPLIIYGRRSEWVPFNIDISSANTEGLLDSLAFEINDVEVRSNHQ